ncbi:MAG: hypothetical protein OEY79_00255 [Anaplasmataceae bacterium]|nr:hypothetical protein [Anaplasmataceae bacterium]
MPEIQGDLVDKMEFTNIFSSEVYGIYQSENYPGNTLVIIPQEYDLL